MELSCLKLPISSICRRPTRDAQLGISVESRDNELLLDGGFRTYRALRKPGQVLSTILPCR